MEIKEKIKTLSDLQSAIDNEELSELIKGLPSGDFVYDKFIAAMKSELETILSNNSENNEKTQQWVSVLDRLDSSLVLQVLQSMEQKLGQTPNESAKRAQPKKEEFIEEEPVDQEEMKRRWEEQQLSGRNSDGERSGKARATVLGPY